MKEKEQNIKDLTNKFFETRSQYNDTIGNYRFPNHPVAFDAFDAIWRNLVPNGAFDAFWHI
jgi:hypothetical protein